MIDVRMLLPALLLGIGMLLPAWPSRAADVPMRLLAAELPPYTFQVPSASTAEFPGPGQGLVHEVVVEMARRAGLPAVIEYMPWTRAQEIALTQPNIGILALTRSPERESRYRWIAKIVSDDLVLVGGAGVDVGSLDAVRNRPTGVLLRSGAEALAREHKFTRIEAVPEEWINAMRMKERRIDAWLAPRLMVIHAYSEVGGDLEALRFGEIIRNSDIYFAASKSLPEATALRWTQAFATMQADGTYDRIVAKYRRLKVAPVSDELRNRYSNPMWVW